MAVVLDSTKNLLCQAAKKRSITTINFIISKAQLLVYYWIFIGYYRLLPIAYNIKTKPVISQKNMKQTTLKLLSSTWSSHYSVLIVQYFHCNHATALYTSLICIFKSFNVTASTDEKN